MILRHDSTNSKTPSPNPLLRAFNSFFPGGGPSEDPKTLLLLRLEKIGRGNAGKSALAHVWGGAS